ncbi:MAG TPA: T9SS type A sorting domain-containing protein [Bacteroidetes bacterium]|nr:T9SS type A sorting domain-containing protein [Bacteroidota bacterium]
MKKILLLKSGKQLLMFLIITLFPVLLVNSQSTNTNPDRNLDSFSDASPHLLLNQDREIDYSPIDTGDVVHSISTPGTNCQGLTWDGSNLWCSDIIFDTIYKLDPDDGAVIHSFASPGDMIEGLTWDGSNLWCSDNTSDIVYKLDADNGSVISSLQFYDVWIHGIAWDGQNLWINDFQNKVILKINPETGGTLLSINAPGTGGIGLTWDGYHIWTDDFNTHKLYCLDPLDGTIIYEVNAPTSNPRDLAWDGQYMWVMGWEASTIYQVDVGNITSVEEVGLSPENLISLSVYPNPVVDEMNIEFVVGLKSKVIIEIYDQNGAFINCLINKNYSPGKYVVKWDGKSGSGMKLPGGGYYCVIRSGATVTSRKIIVL